VHRAGLPVFGEMGPTTFTKYALARSSMLLVFVETPDASDDGYRLVQAVAQELRGSYGLLSAHVDRKTFAEFEKELGGNKDDLPVSILDYSNERSFAFGTRERTAEALLQFAHEFVSGALKPNSRSAEPPSTNDKPVKVVVGHTFEQLVSRSGKDTLIEFYAPWCGHCQKFEPVYEKAAEYLQRSGSDVVLANMDITQNDLPANVNFKFEGIPSLFLSLASGKVIPFKGPRSIEAVLDFVHNHATSPFPKPTVSARDKLLNERFHTPENAAMFGHLPPSDHAKFLSSQEELDELFDEQRIHAEL